jgi:hypothetical protein
LQRAVEVKKGKSNLADRRLKVSLLAARAAKASGCQNEVKEE